MRVDVASQCVCSLCVRSLMCVEDVIVIGVSCGDQPFKPTAVYFSLVPCWLPLACDHMVSDLCILNTQPCCSWYFFLHSCCCAVTTTHRCCCTDATADGGACYSVEQIFYAMHTSVANGLNGRMCEITCSRPWRPASATGDDGAAVVLVDGRAVGMARQRPNQEAMNDGPELHM